MTTDELLGILEKHGVQVVVDEGKPRLRGDTSIVTPKLMKVLRWHRESILERFRPKPRRQFLWRFGHTYTDPDNMPESWSPVGAWWYRYEGEKEWKPIPGMPIQGQPLEVVP